MKNSNNSYYSWLTDEEYANDCKQKLVQLYELYYETQDKKEKEEIFKQLEVYLSIVCDVIAYRYLVKHYTNLFYKLCITVEDYMEYKVKRLLATIKEKKEHIEDILSYTYMSFMLSSPRLIYDYAEKIGHCQLVRDVQPYYQVAREKFFGNGNPNKNEEAEHYIYNVDTIFLDEKDDNSAIRSNLDNFSYTQWKDNKRMEEDGVTDFQGLISLLNSIAENYSLRSKDYLLNLFNNWKTDVESDYNSLKMQTKSGSTYSIIDYIKYKYENKQTDLTQEEYIDVLKILNQILKGGR